MVHPAPLKSKAPQPNSNIILKSGKFPGDAAKLIDLNQQTPETIILLFLNYYLIQKKKMVAVPHTRPSKEPGPNGFIEASKVSIWASMFWQIQVDPRHLCLGR